MVPMYHYVAFACLAAPTLYFLVRTVTAFSLDTLAILVFMIGATIAGLYGRIFPLGVQDRVIRLEERLRLKRLLPDELTARIDEISTEHLIGLRFAPDEEVAELARRILDGDFPDRKGVKEAIRTWRPDLQRI